MKRIFYNLLYLFCLTFLVIILYSFVKPDIAINKYKLDRSFQASQLWSLLQLQEKVSELHSALTYMKRINKTALVTVINDAYLPFAHNWLCNTQFMNIHQQVLVIATDVKSRDEIAKQWPEVNVISLPGDDFHGDQNYSHAGYVRIMVRRTELILKILEHDVEMLLFDLDTFWETNPLPFCMEQVQGYDIGVIPVSQRATVICGGFLYMKPTVNMIRLWRRLTEMMLALDKRIKSLDDTKHVSEADNDQTFISELLRKKYSGIKLKKLSLKDFPDGKWYTMSRSEQEKLSPLVIHNNWIIGNKAKIDRAKAFNQWFWNSENRTCFVENIILKTRS